LTKIKKIIMSTILTGSALSYTLINTNTASAFSLGDFFNPFSYAKAGWKMASNAWEISKDMIGKNVNPFKIGQDAFGRAISISYQLKRSMMINDFDMMDVMMLYGYESYEAAARVMPGSLEDDVVEEMMKTVLSNDTITEYFIRDAIKSKAAAKLMEKMAKKDTDIIEKLGVTMVKDEKVAQQALKLAIKYPEIAKTLLKKMNDNVYSSLISAMYKSRKTTIIATQFLAKYTKEAFDSKHYNFTKSFYNLGNPDDTNDANEIELERMLYVVTKDNEAAKNFLKACNKLNPEQKFQIRNFIVNGRTPDGTIHTDQVYYNMYAMIKGFNRGDALEEVPTGQIAFLNYDALKRCPNLLPRFMTTLITGALLYHDKDCIEMNEKMMKLLPYFMKDENLAKMINKVMKTLNPDPNIPPPEHFTELNAKILQISEDEVSIDSQFKIKQNFFGLDFKDEKLYTEGDQDKWLLLPHWLSPAVWYKTENTEEMRNVPQSQAVATINFKNKGEHIVFLVSSPNSPYLLWALKEGFVPLEKVYVETKYQTGLIVLAKLIEEGTGEQVLYGSGGGKFNYVFGIMKRSAHPYYKYAKFKYKLAKQKIEPKKEINTTKILKRYHFDSKIYEDHYYSADVKAYDGMNYLILKTDDQVIGFDKYNDHQIIGFNDIYDTNEMKLPDYNGDLYAIDYGDGIYVAVGENGTVFMSYYGYNWEKLDVDTDKDLYAVKYAEGKFLVGGEDGRLVVIYPDGTTQILDRGRTHTRGNDILDIQYFYNQFVVVGKEGMIASSPISDITDEWNVEYLSLDGVDSKDITINKIANFDGRRIILTDDGRIVVFSDTKQKWEEKIRSGRLNSMVDVAYGNGYYIAVGKYGALFVSQNGKIWEDTFVDNWISFDTVAYVNGEFLGITKNGLVVKINPQAKKTQIFGGNSIVSSEGINVSNNPSSQSSSGGGCTLGTIGGLPSTLLYMSIPFFIFLRKKFRQ